MVIKNLPLHHFFLVVGFLLFLMILFSGSFTDERENFVAAWFISKGLIPYRDFFFHHAPLPFFIGTPLFWFSQQPWALFRLIIEVWFAASELLTLIIVHKNLRWAVIASWFVFALSAPFINLNMFLAENFMVLSLSSLVLILWSYWQYEKPKFEIVLGSWIVFGWLAVWSSIVALLPLVLLLLVVIIIAHKKGDIKNLLVRRQRKGLVILLTLGFCLHGIVLLYFFITNSLHDAWWAIFSYNIDYYFPLRLLRSSSEITYGFLGALVFNFIDYLSIESRQFLSIHITLFRTMVGILHTFSITNLNSLIQVAYNEWSQKFFTVEMLGFISFAYIFFWFFLKRKYFAFALWPLFALTLRGRENEVFKLSNYYLVIVTFLSIVTFSGLQEKKKHLTFTALLLLVFWVIAVWPMYTQALQQPMRIFNDVSLVKNSQIMFAEKAFVNKTDKIYILGGDPTYYLLFRRLPPEKYYYYHPWFQKTPMIHDEVKHFLSANTSTPVILEPEFSASGTLDYAGDILSILNNNYTKYQPGVYLPKAP